LLKGAGANLAPEVVTAMFDPTVDAKKVSLAADKDPILASAVNFYGDDINEKEVEQFYAAMEQKDAVEPLSYGLNSKLGARKGWQADGTGVQGGWTVWSCT
jgi:dipeptidyl-peptidase-3